jgi:hypothetical protein
VANGLRAATGMDLVERLINELTVLTGNAKRKRAVWGKAVHAIRNH